MKVTTAEPLTLDEMIELSETKDALINLDGRKCRYMRAAEGQEIEVQVIFQNGKIGTYGLRKVSKPNGKYDYLAYRIY